MAKFKLTLSAMKLSIKLAMIGALIFFGALALAILSDKPLLLESLESKTKEDNPVYNQIKWFSFKDKDVWMMNQSHFGLAAEKGKWERLAIVIDKTQNPKTAHFMQLKPGPLEWSEDLKETSYRVSCFMCHTNGPRVIRPNLKSQSVVINLWDQIRAQAWNLRIKTYGRIHFSEEHDLSDLQKIIPFRSHGRLENDELKVNTCVHCHNEDGILARGSLRRQNFMTIRFMVDNGFMPPLGFSLSSAEKKQLKDFLSGF